MIRIAGGRGAPFSEIALFQAMLQMARGIPVLSSLLHPVAWMARCPKKHVSFGRKQNPLPQTRCPGDAGKWRAQKVGTSVQSAYP